jgi:amino-acid N-acetyltransferase
VLSTLRTTLQSELLRLAAPVLPVRRSVHVEPLLAAWASGAAAMPNVMLRPARSRDLRAIHALLDRYAAQGLLLPRSRAQVKLLLPELLVAWDGQEIVGCGALRRYATSNAEIGALAVASHWHGQGIGRLIVHALIEQARRAGVRRVFALTLQDDFFHRLGFETVKIGEFPEKVAKDCAVCARRTNCIEIAVARDVVVNSGDIVA